MARVARRCASSVASLGGVPQELSLGVKSTSPEKDRVVLPPSFTVNESPRDKKGGVKLAVGVRNRGVVF